MTDQSGDDLRTVLKLAASEHHNKRLRVIVVIQGAVIVWLLVALIWRLHV